MKKKILITLGVLVLLLGGLIVAPNLIDWNAYKPQVANGFKAATGQTVRLDGDLSFKLWPSPALRASNVSLANWPGGEAENFLEMDGLDIRLELFPLLSGDVKITSLVIDGGNINLERDLEGRANWEVLFAGKEAAAEPAGEKQVALDSFILRNTAIHYSDPASGTSESVTGIDADLIISSLAGPYTGNGDLVYKGIPLDFTFATGLFSEGANVPLRLGITPDGGKPGLQFQGTFVGEKGVTALSGNFVGGGETALPLVELLVKAAALEETPAGPYDNPYKLDTTVLLVLTPEKTDIVLDPMMLSLGPSTVKGNVHLLYAGRLEAKADLSVDQLTAEDWMAEDSKTEEGFDLPADIKADLKLEVSTAAYKGNSVKNIEFQGALEDARLSIQNLAAVLPGNSDLRLTGDLSSKTKKAFMTAKVHLDSRRFRELAAWLDIDLSAYPGNRVNRLTFDGKVRLADPALEVMDATITLDSTRFAGGLTLDTADPTLFAVAGSINDLDLDTYYPDLLQKKEYASLGEKINAWQESLKGLVGYTGTIDLKAGRIKMAGANLENITFQGGLSGNDIEISKLEIARFEGTKVSASGAVRDIPGKLAYDLTAALSSDSFKALMAWSETASPFEERVVPSGQIAVKLTGTKTAGRYDLSGDLSGIAFSVKGTGENLLGKPVLAANLRLSHDRMIEFVRKFTPEYFPARTPLGVFSLTASLKGDEEDLRFDDLALQLGPSRFEGNLRYQTRDGRANYTGALVAQRVRLDDYMAPEEAGISQVVKGGSRWSGDEWDTTFLKENDFDVTFSADAVSFRTYNFANPKVRLRARAGVMTVDNLSAGFYGGTLGVNAVMDATAVPYLKADVTLKGVSTLDALKSSADISRLTGTLDFTGAYEGRGNSQQAILATLSGTSKLSTSNGLIRGIDLPKLSESLKNVQGLQAIGTILTSPFKGGQTAYRFIRTDIKVKNGVATFDKIDSDVDASQIGGRGRVDLPNWQMDISGGIKLAEHPALPAIGVNMKGRIDDAKVSFDTNPLKENLLKGLQDSLFQNLLKKPEQPKDTGGGNPAIQTPASETPEKEAEPTPEEQMLKGIFDLLGGQEEDEEDTEEEGDDEGGGGGRLLHPVP